MKSSFCDEIRLKTEKYCQIFTPTTLFSPQYTNIVIYQEKTYLKHNAYVTFESYLDCIELISRAQSPYNFTLFNSYKNIF